MYPKIQLYSTVLSGSIRGVIRNYGHVPIAAQYHTPGPTFHSTASSQGDNSDHTSSYVVIILYFRTETCFNAGSLTLIESIQSYVTQLVTRNELFDCCTK